MGMAVARACIFPVHIRMADLTRRQRAREHVTLWTPDFATCNVTIFLRDSMHEPRLAKAGVRVSV